MTTYDPNDPVIVSLIEEYLQDEDFNAVLDISVIYTLQTRRIYFMG